MSSSNQARIGIVLGAAAVLAVPGAAAAATYTTQTTLLQAVYIAVPVAFVTALASISCYRRARSLLERTVRRRGEALVGAARILGYAGLYAAVTAALALGFYGLLHLTA
jgi:hypothetical protein